MRAAQRLANFSVLTDASWLKVMCSLLALNFTASCVPAVGYPSSPGLSTDIGANRQLTTFGRDNPQCLLWTDWQRLCSRTGPQATLRCVRDAARPVAASQPFCAAAPGPGNDAYAANFSALRQTSTRFCAVQVADANEARQEGEPDLCDSYKPGRPFNGRRLAAMRHPWCETWADAETQSPVCSESVKGNARSCKALASVGYEHERLLVCTAWRPDTPCRRPFAGASPRDREGLVIGGVPDPNGSPVFGTICLD